MLLTCKNVLRTAMLSTHHMMKVLMQSLLWLISIHLDSSMGVPLKFCSRLKRPICLRGCILHRRSLHAHFLVPVPAGHWRKEIVPVPAGYRRNKLSTLGNALLCLSLAFVFCRGFCSCKECISIKLSSLFYLYGID